MTNILSSSGGLDYPQYFPETSIDFLNNRFIPPEYTFTRNSAGTYVGADRLIKYASANEPRFDYDPATGESLGLLIEESRTNIATYSEDFANAIWNKQNGFSITSNTATAPDGTLTADTASRSSSVQYLYQNLNHSPGTYTLSCWVRSVTGTAQFIMSMYNIIDGTQVSQTFTAATSWQRFSHTGTMTVNATGFYPCIPAVLGEQFYIWGAQIEAGSFPTSYIPTSGSAVTRQPDQLVLNKPFNSLGTFFIEATPTTGTTLSADNGTSGLVMSSTGKEALYYNTNRTLRMSSDYSPSLYNSTTPQDLNRVSLGFDKLNNTNYINGYLKKFMYYGSPVTEDNLRSLTGNTKEIFRYKWTPEELDTSLWFSADDVSTIIESGGEVNTWLDKSGNNRDGITSSPHTKPSYSIQSFNGKGSIYFDSTDLIDISGFNLDLSPFTIIFVGEGNLNSAGTNNIPRLYFNNGSISYVNNIITSWIEDNTKRIVSWTFDGIDSHIVHRNATPVATATISATSGLVNNYVIGRSGTPYSNGAFCEYIVLREKISDSNRQKLEGYLAHKWGLRDILPNNHPYKTSLPV